MKKRFKNGLSILLSVILLLSIFAVLPVSSSAKEIDNEEIGANSLTLSQVTDWLNNEIRIGATRGRGECVDFCNYYLTDCWGISAISGNARDWRNKCPSGWTIINLNGSFNNCQIGDLLVEDYSPYGHVSVYYGVENGKHMVVDQNNQGRRYTGKGRLWADFSNPMYCFRPNYANPNPTPQGYVMSESEGAGQTIPNGDYWICNKIAQDYFVDIPGTNYNIPNETNLEMCQGYVGSETNTKYDVFSFKYLNNGYYKITQMTTNKAIDVTNGSLYRGTNVQMYEYNGSNAQQWSVEKTDAGYKLRSRCNNYYLDVYNGNYESGTNLHIWTANDTSAQFFGFLPYAPDERPINDGIYTLKSAVGNTCYLDVSGVPGEYKNDSNVQIWNWNEPEEKYKFEYVGNGYYRIYEATSNLPVEIINDNVSYLDKNRNAKLYSKNDSRGQFWKIKKNTDGTYFFINKLSGYYLDVYNGNTTDGTNVHIHPYNGSNAQKWQPKRVLQDYMVKVNSWKLINGVMKANITVTVDDTQLNENTDYTVSSYIKNDKLYAKVTGIGNYCDSVLIEYQEETDKIGDINGDNSVDVLDAAMVQKYSSGKVELTAEQLEVADVNGDNNIDVLDAAEIQKFAAGKITEFKKKS